MADTELLRPDDIPAPAKGHATTHRLNGLDGFRALAVVVVTLYHFGVPGFLGGWVGPELFFVLSGYLITTLLIDRSDGDPRRTNLLDFWIRRIRRLYPAILLLVAALVGIVALMTALGDPVVAGIDPSSLRSESFASLGYYANWHLISQHVSYFGSSTVLLKHLWSLAIEEQFYVVFPLVFLLIGLARSRWRLTGLVVARVGAAASAALAGVVIQSGNINLVYYSTQTNAYHLLIGVAMAFALHGWTPGARTQRMLGVLSVVSVAGIVVFIQVASDASGSPRTWMFSGGGVALDLIAAILIASLVYGPVTSPISWVFNLRPIVWIGAVSYGIYLWHYPFAVLITPVNTHLLKVGVVFLQIALTLVMTAFSYYTIERIVRETEIRPRALRWSIYAVSTAAVVVLVAFTPQLVSSLSS